MANILSGRIKTIAFFLLLFLESFGLAVYTASIPGDEKNAVFLGYSLARLALIGLLGLLGVAALAIAWAAYRKEAFYKRVLGLTQKHTKVNWPILLSGLAFLIGWLALFLPSYWFGAFEAYYVRLRPLLYWVGLVGLQTFLVFTLPGASKRLKDLIIRLRKQRTLGISILLSLFVLLGFWILIALTGLGVKSEPYFWNEAGVPVLGLQLILSLVVVMTFNRLVLLKLNDHGLWLDIIFGFGLYAFALVLWSQVPVMRSYFSPGPYMPGPAFHPYSDAAQYDFAAQYLLMGQGIANGQYMDKPFYVLMLAVFRLLTGQDYEQTIFVQTLVMALTPVGGYFLGKAMVNRQTGLLVGLLMAFQQFNALNATPYILVSHSKMMMTEYPTAMMLVFGTLAGFKWLRQSEKWALNAILTGGVLGLAVLARPNAFTVLPFVILLGFFAFKNNIRTWFVGALVCSVAFMAVVGPWFLDTPKGFTEPYLFAKIRAVIETRYYDTQLPWDNDQPSDELSQSSVSVNLKPVFPERPGQAVNQQINQTEDVVSIPFIPNHYFHNHVMAFFILPHTAELKNLRETLQAPYWDNVLDWDGALPVDTGFLVLLNIVILSIGIGTSWNRWRYAGLTPLMVIMSYFLANAVARTSGSRYLVAVDWVLLVYFAIGVLQGLAWLGIVLGVQPSEKVIIEPEEIRIEQKSNNKAVVGAGVGLMAVFLIIGLSLPLSQHLFPQRYDFVQTHEVLLEMRENGFIQFTQEELQIFMNSQNHLAIQGLGIHPRHYPTGVGEPLSPSINPDIAQLRARPYTRLTMTILAPEGYYTVILPIHEVPLDYPTGVDMVAIGCWNGPEYFLDAWAVIALTDPPITLWRDDGSPMICPLPAPKP